MPREIQSCGTPAGNSRHLALGEQPCQACREARNRYERERKAKVRAGLPSAMPKPSLRERLLSKAIINLETGCWEWTGAKDRAGYGRFQFSNRRWIGSHRAVYELLVGSIPEGFQIDHLCRNVSCCNPAHLEPVTPRENTLRSTSASALNAVKTRCVNGHELTPENTYLRFDRTNAGRQCRTCRRDAERRRSERNRAERHVPGTQPTTTKWRV